MQPETSRISISKPMRRHLKKNTNGVIGGRVAPPQENVCKYINVANDQLVLDPETCTLTSPDICIYSYMATGDLIWESTIATVRRISGPHCGQSEGARG